jgi:hypothetical protein
MNFKMQKLLLHLLEFYENDVYGNTNRKRDPFFKNFFSKKELIEILEYIYGTNCLLKKSSDSFSIEQLFRLIKHDGSLTAYLMEQVKMNLEAIPSFTQTQVKDFFKEIHFELHYLSTKPIQDWDVYDRNHYRTLLQRAGVKLNNQKLNTNETKK